MTLRTGGAKSRRRKAAVLAASLVVLGAVGWGLTRVTVDTQISSFVPSGDDASAQLTQYQEQFGSDAVVVILHGTSPQGILLDPAQLLRLVHLEGELSELPNVKSVYGPGTVLNQTAGAVQGVLQQIAGARDEIINLAKAGAAREHLSASATTAAVNAALAPFDQRYGALLVQALPVGLPTLSNQRFVASVLFDNKGNPRSEWKFLVPDATSATILIRPLAGLSQNQSETLVNAVRTTVGGAGLSIKKPVISGAPVLVNGIAAKARSEIPLLGGVALGGVAIALFTIPWTKRRRRLVPLAAALLGTATTVAIFGVIRGTLSVGVVAFLPVLLGVGSDFPLYLIQSRRPHRILVVVVGASCAFASLAVSTLPFVREFGIALAIGILVTAGWALALRFVIGGHAPAEGTVARDAPVVGVRSRKVRIGVASAAVLAALAGWLLMPSMRLQSSPEQLAAGVPQLSDLAAAEKTLGFSGEIDVVLRGPNVLTPEGLKWAAAADAAAAKVNGVTPLLSFGQLLHFLGTSPTTEQISAGAQILPQYLTDAVLGSDGRAASATFGVRLDDVRAQQSMLDQLKSVLPLPPSGDSVTVVGLPVLAVDSLSEMNRNRYAINVLGMLLAAVVIGVGLRSVRSGARVLLTAGLAAGWLFLGLRALDSALSPLTIAIGALVTVTSSEFVAMLAENRGGRLPGARIGVIAAAVAGTAGYAALGLSDVAVLKEFGLMLAAGVVCSFIAAQLVTTFVRSRPHPRPLEVTEPHAPAVVADTRKEQHA